MKVRKCELHKTCIQYKENNTSIFQYSLLTLQNICAACELVLYFQQEKKTVLTCQSVACPLCACLGRMASCKLVMPIVNLCNLVVHFSLVHGVRSRSSDLCVKKGTSPLGNVCNVVAIVMCAILGFLLCDGSVICLLYLVLTVGTTKEFLPVLSEILFASV